MNQPGGVARRTETEAEIESETQVGAEGAEASVEVREDWQGSLAVEDEQLVDWAETVTSDGD